MKPLALALLALVLGIGTLLYFLGDDFFRDDGEGGARAGGAAVSPGTASGTEPVSSAPVTELAPPPGEVDEQRASVPIESRADAAPAPAEEPPKGPFLRGKVIDANGFAVPDVAVTLTALTTPSGLFNMGGGSLRREATTAHSGIFEIPRGKTAGGEVRLHLLGRGFLPFAEGRTPDTETGDGWLGSFTLEWGIVLGGVVLDAAGEPVSGAKVRRVDKGESETLGGILALASTLSGDSAGPVETDSAGRFELAHEPNGEYVILVEHDAHPSGRLEGTAPRAGLEQLDLVVRLAPSARIAGYIRDFPQGKTRVQVRARPVDQGKTASGGVLGALLTGAIEGHTSQVSEDGTFELEGLAVETRYEVVAFRKDGFLDDVPCSDEVTAVSGMEYVELVWDAGARVVCRVFDEVSRSSLSDVTVRFRWKDVASVAMSNAPKTRRFADGNVVLDELRPSSSPGRLELLVSAEGYLERREEGILVHEDAEVDLGDVYLGRAPVLRVRAVDGDGEPVNRARVSLRPEESSFVLVEGSDAEESMDLRMRPSSGSTDRDGWCELFACSTPSATVFVKKSGFATYERAGVPMPGSEGGEWIAQLTEGGVAEILVLDTLGRPVAEAPVMHRDPDGALKSLQTGSKGTVKVKNLAAGDHGFRAARPSGVPGVSFEMEVSISVGMGEGADPEAEAAWTTVAVHSGRTTTVTLEVPASASVIGVVRAGGALVEGALVQLLRGESDSPSLAVLQVVSDQMSSLMPGAKDRGRTDVHGVYRLEDVPVGQHRLRVERSNGAPPLDVPVDLREGENVVDIDLPSVEIEGFVVDPDGTPIPGATVNVRRQDPEELSEELAQVATALSLFGATLGSEGVTTDANGAFTIQGVPPDVPLIVVARASGFVQGNSSAVTVAEGEIESGVRVVLAIGGSIRVRYTGAPGVFQVISALYEGDADLRPAPRIEFLQGSELVLRDLRPGTWEVRIDGASGEDEIQPVLVDVFAREETTVTLGP